MDRIGLDLHNRESRLCSLTETGEVIEQDAVPGQIVRLEDPGLALWIRRVLVRSQEGQLEARCDIESCRASTVLDPLFGLVRRVLFEGQIEF